MTGNGFLTADQLRSRGRREVELPSGGRVLVGRVGMGDLACFVECLPDVSSLAARAEGRQEDARLTPAQVKRAQDAIERVMVAGLLSPRLSQDPDAGPTPADFPYEDQLAIFNAVLELSGLSRRKADEVLPLSGAGT